MVLDGYRRKMDSKVLNNFKLVSIVFCCILFHTSVKAKTLYFSVIFSLRIFYSPEKLIY